jgi:glutathionylspermidine synthase
VFQWVWLEQQLGRGVLPAGADQFNSVHEKLVEAFRQLRDGKPYRLHLTCLKDTEEDRGTVAYLEDCAKQAGLATQFLYVDEIGMTGDGRFVDLANTPIEVLFKLYPWEWMMREDFGKAVPRARTQFIEPIWKAVLSNKGLLPFLWKKAPGHPNLLPAFFADEDHASIAKAFVEKPLLSREGANVRVVQAGVASTQTDGPYGEEGFIRQQHVTIPNFGGGHVIIGAWVVASEPAGMLVREDASPITGNTARFLPHFIEP